jgi:hypothetical protein
MGLYLYYSGVRFYKYETIKNYGGYNFPEGGHRIISLLPTSRHVARANARSSTLT